MNPSDILTRLSFYDALDNNYTAKQMDDAFKGKYIRTKIGNESFYRIGRIDSVVYDSEYACGFNEHVKHFTTSFHLVITYRRLNPLAGPGDNNYYEEKTYVSIMGVSQSSPLTDELKPWLAIEQKSTLTAQAANKGLLTADNEPPTTPTTFGFFRLSPGAERVQVVEEKLFDPFKDWLNGFQVSKNDK
jgi:hypothetical protein